MTADRPPDRPPPGPRAPGPDVGAPARLFAVLDGARDPRVHERVTSERPSDWRCLYAGPLPPALERAAPYLVRLTPGSGPLDLLLEDARGESVGVLVASPEGVDIDRLRRHFRRFLKATGPDGRTLIFRYYDPRVLRVYLPTCNRDELGILFGSVVSRYIVEQRDGTLRAYAHAGDRLTVEAIEVDDVLPLALEEAPP